MTDFAADRGASARLEMNARAYRPDPQLDRALELFHTDRPAFDRLPVEIKGQVDIYADLQQHYRAAVEAGVIPDNRTARTTR